MGRTADKQSGTPAAVRQHRVPPVPDRPEQAQLGALVFHGDLRQPHEGATALSARPLLRLRRLVGRFARRILVCHLVTRVLAGLAADLLAVVTDDDRQRRRDGDGQNAPITPKVDAPSVTASSTITACSFIDFDWKLRLQHIALQLLHGQDDAEHDGRLVLGRWPPTRSTRRDHLRRTHRRSARTRR